MSQSMPTQTYNQTVTQRPRLEDYSVYAQTFTEGKPVVKQNGQKLRHRITPSSGRTIDGAAWDVASWFAHAELGPASLSQTHSTGEREIVFVVPSQMTRKITLHVADKGQGKLFLCDDDLVDIDED